MQKSNIICIVFFSFFIPHQVWAQGFGGDSIQNKFQFENKKTIREKMFIHVDRPFYFVGETMWYKIYNLEAYSHKLLNINKIAYIELFDNKGQAVIRNMISIAGGTGNGYFFLPESLQPGVYTLIAYTNWMKNEDPGFFSQQQVTIRKKHFHHSLIKNSKQLIYDIQFLPEGGDLVNGIKSIVAFRALDSLGKGMTVDGEIRDQSDFIVAQFRTFKFGMGHFEFIPQKGKVYHATVKGYDALPTVYSFPVARDKGYVMHVWERDSNSISVLVKSNNNLMSSVYIMVYCDQEVLQVERKMLSDGSAFVSLDKTGMRYGISHIMILDSSFRPLCERLYFLFPPAGFDIKTKLDSDIFVIRNKINLDIQTNSLDGKPLPSNLSVSVYQTDSSFQELNDIYSYEWLSADIPSKVECPEYYFRNSDKEVKEAIDNLMMTQGWRKCPLDSNFTLHRKNFIYMPEAEGKILSVKMTDKKTHLPQEGKLIFLSLAGRNFKLSAGRTNKEGIARFTVRDFWNTNELTIQAEESSDCCSIEFLSSYIDSLPADYVKRVNLEKPNEPSDLQIDNAFVKKVFDSKATPLYIKSQPDTSLFYGKPDRSYNTDEYTRFRTMEEVMREYIADITVGRRNNGFDIHVFDKPLKSFFVKQPLILLDGVPIFNQDSIMNYDPLKINKIDVVTHRYYLGPASFDGIISFSTYNGDLDGFQLDPQILVVDLQGLQQGMEFYSPGYEINQQYLNRHPDFRTLLYWNPNVYTDSSGKASVSWFTSDLPGNYVIVVNGVSQSGLLGYTKRLFDVLIH